MSLTAITIIKMCWYSDML